MERLLLGSPQLSAFEEACNVSPKSVVEGSTSQRRPPATNDNVSDLDASLVETSSTDYSDLSARIRQRTGKFMDWITSIDNETTWPDLLAIVCVAIVIVCLSSDQASIFFNYVNKIYRDFVQIPEEIDQSYIRWLEANSYTHEDY
jgi:hypothetical protein